MKKILLILIMITNLTAQTKAEWYEILYTTQDKKGNPKVAKVTSFNDLKGNFKALERLSKKQKILKYEMIPHYEKHPTHKRYSDMTPKEKKDNQSYLLKVTYIDKDNKKIRSLKTIAYKNISKEIKKIRDENKEIISVNMKKQ